MLSSVASVILQTFLASPNWKLAENTHIHLKWSFSRCSDIEVSRLGIKVVARIWNVVASFIHTVGSIYLNYKLNFIGSLVTIKTRAITIIAWFYCDEICIDTMALFKSIALVSTSCMFSSLKGKIHLKNLILLYTHSSFAWNKKVTSLLVATELWRWAKRKSLYSCVKWRNNLDGIITRKPVALSKTVLTSLS